MLRKEQNDLLTQTGPGTPMGELFRRYWHAGAARRGTAGERMPAGAGQAPVRAAAGLARHPGPLCADRRVLRAPRRLAVVRPQRGERPALPLSRLEIRPHRPVHRGAVGAGGKRLLQEDQAEVLSAGRARRRAVDLHGPAGAAAAAAGVGVRHGAGRRSASSSKRLQECNWLQAMEGGIDSSHVSFLHSRRARTRTRCSRARRATSTTWATRSRVFEVVESPGGLYIGARRNAEDGNYYWRITQWVMPLHHDPAARPTIRCTATSGCRSTTRTAGPGASTTIRRVR